MSNEPGMVNELKNWLKTSDKPEMASEDAFREDEVARLKAALEVESDPQKREEIGKQLKSMAMTVEEMRDIIDRINQPLGKAKATAATTFGNPEKETNNGPKPKGKINV